MPSNWIRGIGDYKTLLINYGIPYLKGKLFKIFVSSNINDEPDFRLCIREQFDVVNRACYTGLIKYSFGKVKSYQLLWTKIIVVFFFNSTDTLDEGLVFFSWLSNKTRTRVGNRFLQLNNLGDSDVEESQDDIEDDGDDTDFYFPANEPVPRPKTK